MLGGKRLDLSAEAKYLRMLIRTTSTDALMSMLAKYQVYSATYAALILNVLGQRKVNYI